MLALALYDYIINTDEQNLYQQQLISFQRGAVLDVLQSNGGWSYGRIVQKPLNENPFTSSNSGSSGWFPTSYLSYYDSPLSTTQSYGNTVNKESNSNFNIVADPERTDKSEDDEGFYGTPMGGYIEPEEEKDNNAVRHATNDDRDTETLPPGVATVPVPSRRQLRVITMPKNLVSNIATTTSKVTNRLYRRQNNTSSTTTSPVVYVSPSKS